MKRARISSGAVKVTWPIWLTTAIHSFAADRRAMVSALIASMLPVHDFGVPVAVPVKAAQDAAIASMASVLPAR